MTLTNGSGYNIVSNTCNKSGADGTNSFAYGSDKIEIVSFAVKYYYNDMDTPIYTSDEATVDVYPMLINYYEDTSKITQLDTTSTSITWTLNAGYPCDDTVMNLGLEDQTSSADYYNMRFCFVVNGGSKLLAIKESGSTVKSLSGFDPVANGDTFKIQFAGTGGNGNITFPQIPESKNIKNSAFMS